MTSMEQLMSRKAAFDAALDYAERSNNLPEEVEIADVLSHAAAIHAFLTESETPVVRTATEDAIVEVIDQAIAAVPAAPLTGEVVTFLGPASEPSPTVVDPEPVAEVQAEPEVEAAPARTRKPRQTRKAKAKTRRTRGNGHADGSGEAEQVTEPSPAESMERVYQAQPEAPVTAEAPAQETAPMAA